MKQDAVELTRMIMRKHYERDLDFVIEQMAEDIMWIGPIKSQFINGLDNFKKILEIEQGIPFQIKGDVYELVGENEKGCVVSGKYTVYNEGVQNYIMLAEQRCTFVYRRQEGRLLAIHIHVSNTADNLLIGDEKYFPFKAGRENYEYMQKLIQEKISKEKKVCFKGLDKEEYFVDINQIIYIEAGHRKSRLQCVGQAMYIRVPIGEIETKLPAQFVRIHRSYIINLDYVLNVQYREITMYDGSTLPIPEKRYHQVLKSIQDYHENHSYR